MNVETMQSAANTPSTPPPPPPAPPKLPTGSSVMLTAKPAMNHRSNSGDDGRWRLLDDICKGTTLRKISITDSNNNNNHHVQNNHKIFSSQDVSEINL